MKYVCVGIIACFMTFSCQGNTNANGQADGSEDPFATYSTDQQPQWIALEPAGQTIVPGVHATANLDADLNGREVPNYRMPQFRRQFDVTGKVRSAKARVCGLGHFDLFMNGKKVGNHFLDPGWTCYDKEALYVDFDVTSLLKKGQNTIDVMLGSGFYTIPCERYFKLLCSYGQPKLWMELYVDYADGNHLFIPTDCDNWQVCESPITFSSIYGGETYDACKAENLQWQRPLPAPTDIQLKPQDGTELVVRCEVPEKMHFQNEAGQWIYDLGQNFSGIVRLSVCGERGREVSLWPAELLNQQKDVHQGPTGTPYHWDYILRGDKKAEEWQPQFTYFGLRYVRVEGAVPEGEANPEGLPVIKELTGLHTCTSAAETGSFSCGDTLFCQIHELIDWAIRSNLQSVMTDCPHREKLGWQEQNHLMQYSVQYRYDMLHLYRKILCDLENSQLENGCIPTIAPMYVEFCCGFEDTPEWGSSFIICPWYAYLWYGDRSLIEQHYPAMKRYIEYLGSRADDNIVAYGLGDWFDIGPGAPGYSQLTSNGLTATAIYYYDVSLMARMAELLNQNEDAEKYRQLAVEIRQSYNTHFYHADGGYYDRNSQCANAVSLYMDLVEDSEREKVLESLIADIRDRGYSLTAGDVGYRFVLQALQDAGRSDVIYKMNSRTDVPGYGWQIVHGATCLTESWQAYDNVSNNHLMLGHLMEWLYGGLCGIRQTEESVAFRHLLIAPQIIPEIGYADGTLDTPQGKVESHWKLADGELRLKVVVPQGSDALISLPEYGFSKQVASGKHKFTIKVK